MTKKEVKRLKCEKRPVQDRIRQSKLGDAAVAAERLVASANKTMEAPLASNQRLDIRPVLDSKIATGILVDNGFETSELVSAVFVAVPSTITIMPRAQWVIDKYTTGARSFSEIKVYNKADFKYNVIGYGVNNMEHDRGSKLVFGGKIGAQMYVAPYMLVEKLNKHNTLDNQVFNGYLLGLDETEKGALKSNPESHYSGVLRQNAYDLVLDTEYAGFQSFIDVTEHNEWAFKALDGYKVSNKEYWSNEAELDIMELSEAFIESLEAQDWRFSSNKIARNVILKMDDILSSFIDFYNGDAVIEAITEVEMDKQKFGDVQAELIKLAEYYVSNTSDEDNAFSIDESIEDYDVKSKNDHSQRRGYKKAYIEKDIQEMAIARAAITEIIHRKHYSRSMECYELELELKMIREASVAHKKELEQRFKQNKEEQAYWDRMEAKLGVKGLTAFIPASVAPNTEAEWASRSDEHFAFFMNDLRHKMEAKQ